MSFDSPRDNIWPPFPIQQHLPHASGSQDTPYDPINFNPGSAAFEASWTGVAGDSGYYGQLLVDAVGQDESLAILTNLLPYVTGSQAPTPSMSAGAGLQPDEAPSAPHVIDAPSTFSPSVRAIDSPSAQSPMTDSTPSLSFDVGSSGSSAGAPSPATPAAPGPATAASLALSLSPARDTMTEDRAEGPTPAAPTTTKRGAKRARVLEDESELASLMCPQKTKRAKARKTKRDAANELGVDDDLNHSSATASPSPAAQVSPAPALPTALHADVSRLIIGGPSGAQPAQKKVRKAKRRPGKNSAGAGPGSNAQKNNNAKSRPARAYEKYADDLERRKAALRVALRVLEQPQTADLPQALPPKLEDDVVQAIQGIIDSQPDVARSGDDEWVECKACRKDYGILERVLKDKEADHLHDCHGVTGCVLCGCPVVRGDIVQWRRHRKSNCPLWRVLVKRGQHVDWLESNGLLDADAKVYSRQFFGADVRREADDVLDDEERRDMLLEALKEKEVAKLPDAVHSSEPFEGMIAKKVLKALRGEIEGEEAAEREVQE
ncbi:hypothetical protein AURDEDRAFT_120854 [Auricularia subglabra TFB-10046 SS5]|nr:hypothetical protein AURDEDRAFT_120854 [Auricularia subglabra TFB-10046 SS5]